jgi:hypothetical protein
MLRRGVNNERAAAGVEDEMARTGKASHIPRRTSPVFKKHTIMIEWTDGGSGGRTCVTKLEVVQRKTTRRSKHMPTA